MSPSLGKRSHKLARLAQHYPLVKASQRRPAWKDYREPGFSRGQMAALLGGTALAGASIGLLSNKPLVSELQVVGLTARDIFSYTKSQGSNVWGALRDSAGYALPGFKDLAKSGYKRPLVGAALGLGGGAAYLLSSK